MDGPDSSYSCFEIHICWKVESEAQDGASDPYGVFPLWWSNDLDHHGAGASALISFCIRSAIPGT